MIYKTLTLDSNNWDLAIDDDGNLSVSSGGYALSQDVASACMVFSGECYFDNTLGVPWREEVLGSRVSDTYLCAKLKNEALKNDDVADCQVNIIFNGSDRRLSGSILITDSSGEKSEISV